MEGLGLSTATATIGSDGVGAISSLRLCVGLGARYRIDAPWSTACEGIVEEDEAKQYRAFEAIEGRCEPTHNIVSVP
jgi:hypothetical protein